MSKRAKLVSS